ncbi:hypothetical protein [Azotobacter salinestris]|uniref:hypothetical protein n=1 Tax=Azotobacter salinestris TaxID=69964 RepID=UPI0032DF43B0
MSNLGTLVRIIVAGSEGKAASMAWVDEAEKSGFGGMSRHALFELDCEYRALLHRAMIPRHWNALVAYYGLDAREKDQAIMELIPVIATHAHHHFKVHAVFTWAKPKLAGRDGKRSTVGVLRPELYDLVTWDDGKGTPDRTMRYWRKGIHGTLNEMRAEAENAAISLLVDQGLLEKEAA